MKLQILQISFLLTCMFVATIAAVDVEGEDIQAEVELQLKTALKIREVDAPAKKWKFGKCIGSIDAVGVAVSKQQAVTGNEAQKEFYIIICAAIPAHAMAKAGNFMKNTGFGKFLGRSVFHVTPKRKDPVANTHPYVVNNPHNSNIQAPQV